MGRFIVFACTSAILFAESITATIFTVSPGQSIASVLSGIQANNGHSVEIAAGTYQESGTITIPEGVSISGAGPQATIIESSAPTALQIMGNGTTGGNVQEIAGFTVDGKGNTNALWGINLENSCGITVRDIDIRNFEEMGLRLDNLVGCEIYNINISNSAKGFSSSAKREGEGVPDWAIIGCSGALGVGNLENCLFHDMVVDEDEAYAVKVSSYKIWNNSSRYLKDCEFYNIDFKTSDASCSEWGKLCVELFDIDNFNVKFHNCRFTTSVSLIPNHAFDFPNRGIEFYNNFFDIHKSGNNYACEFEHQNITMHHNYFEGGLYPLALWGGRDVVKGMNVHHNVFYDQNGPHAPINLESGVESGVFANNTVVLTDAMWDGFKVFNMNPGYQSNLRVANNVFVKNTSKGYSFNNGSIGTVENNLFSGLGAEGNKSFTDDPQLNGNAQGLDRFVAGNTNAVTDRGVTLAGITDGFAGSAPDLGAFEDGVTFKYGIDPTIGGNPVATRCMHNQGRMNAQVPAVQITRKSIIINLAPAHFSRGAEVGVYSLLGKIIVSSEISSHGTVSLPRTRLICGTYVIKAPGLVSTIVVR